VNYSAQYDDFNEPTLDNWFLFEDSDQFTIHCLHSVPNTHLLGSIENLEAWENSWIIM
jgi:hypothetical protein